MKYRVATVKDLPEITRMINGCGYYGPMSATNLDGPIVVAEHDGELKGCLWAMVCGRHAFIDYGVTEPRNGRVYLMLVLTMEKLLQENGVKYVRSNIIDENRSVVRGAKAMGYVAQPGYHLIYKRLPDGKPQGRVEHTAEHAD